MSSLAAASNAPAHSHQLQSCRLFHDAKGRMHLIKPSNPQPLNKLHDTHITATLYARELLSSKRFPTAPNESTETLDNWSIYDEKLAMGKVGEWRDSRYSPYLPDGVPTKGRMKFDNIIEFVRVRIFNRKPITLERKRDEAILKETLNYRYGQNPGLLSTLRLKIKRWNLKKEEKYDIIDKLLQQDPRYGKHWNPFSPNVTEAELV